MLPITSEWVGKAEGDWTSAHLLYRARKYPNYDGSCFHAQQCAEKYLKARLEEAGVDFPRTHNLVHLLSLALTPEPSWTMLDLDVQNLTIHAVAIRYPGPSASRSDARDAIANCRSVRSAVRMALGLPL